MCASAPHVLEGGRTWYAHCRLPRAVMRPSDSAAPRCGQRSSSATGSMPAIQGATGMLQLVSMSAKEKRAPRPCDGAAPQCAQFSKPFCAKHACCRDDAGYRACALNALPRHARPQTSKRQRSRLVCLPSYPATRGSRCNAAGRTRGVVPACGLPHLGAAAARWARQTATRAAAGPPARPAQSAPAARLAAEHQISTVLSGAELCSSGGPPDRGRQPAALSAAHSRPGVRATQRCLLHLPASAMLCTGRQRAQQR